MNSNTSYTASVVFDAADYEMEDQGLAASADWTSVTTTSDMQEAHPRYVPPHRRRVRLDMADETVIQARDPAKPDDQGVDNRLFQKLLVYVHFALTALHIKALSRRFPGMFFQSDDHCNHDHPIAHVVTQVGTRLLQRMIPRGARVLDIYGNPKAAEAFNRGQARSMTPKVMDTLVSKMCPSDFIRSVNKWALDYAEALGNHLTGTIGSLTQDIIGRYSHFTMIHTLYYVKPQDICQLLSTGGKILALVHRHDQPHGFLNDGEQEYWVRSGILKQRNVMSNTCYYHPNVTPFWFREDKKYTEIDGKTGFTWEVHFVCEDTWIVEIVPYNPEEQVDFDVEDWQREFEFGEEMHIDVVVNSKAVKPVKVLPSPDGKFVELRVTNLELFNNLRRQAAGKVRHGKEGAKVLESLLASAKHLSAPGDLFPGKAPLTVPEGTLVDHVISAFVTDAQHETNLMEATNMLSGTLAAHKTALRGGPAVTNFSLSSLVEALRASVKASRAIHKVVRSTDVVGSALATLDEALE